jgi:RimJ/RimL family protein N-acetyltransferase
MGLGYVLVETTDFKYIRDTLIDPYVWRWASDDSSPRPELYFPLIHDEIIWAKVNDLGVFMAQQIEPDRWEVHIALNRRARGEALDISRAAMAWFRQRVNPPYTLVANIPHNNYLAIRLALELGFKHIGPFAKPFIKNGRTYRRDTYIYKQEI